VRVSDAAKRERQPRLGFYYAPAANAPGIREHGIHSSAPISLRLLSESEARALYGIERGMPIVYFRIDLEAMRSDGVPMPPLVYPELGEAEPRVDSGDEGLA